MATNGNTTNTNGKTNGATVAVDDTTKGWEPDFRDQVVLALRDNGGLNRIQATMRQHLDESGWIEDLKKYVTELYRSGKASTYDEALALVNQRMKEDDESSAALTPDLTIPDDAKLGGAEAVKKELRGVVKTKNASNAVGGPAKDGAAFDAAPKTLSPAVSASMSLEAPVQQDTAPVSGTVQSGHNNAGTLDGGLVAQMSQSTLSSANTKTEVPTQQSHHTPEKAGLYQSGNGDSGTKEGSQASSGGSGKKKLDTGLNGGYWAPTSVYKKRVSDA